MCQNTRKPLLTINDVEMDAKIKYLQSQQNKPYPNEGSLIGAIEFFKIMLLGGGLGLIGFILLVSIYCLYIIFAK
jgi:hypothetical protein